MPSEIPPLPQTKKYFNEERNINTLLIWFIDDLIDLRGSRGVEMQSLLYEAALLLWPFILQM